MITGLIYLFIYVAVGASVTGMMNFFIIPAFAEESDQEYILPLSIFWGLFWPLTLSFLSLLVTFGYLAGRVRR